MSPFLIMLTSFVLSQNAPTSAPTDAPLAVEARKAYFAELAAVRKNRHPDVERLRGNIKSSYEKDILHRAKWSKELKRVDLLSGFVFADNERRIHLKYGQLKRANDAMQRAVTLQQRMSFEGDLNTRKEVLSIISQCMLDSLDEMPRDVENGSKKTPASRPVEEPTFRRTKWGMSPSEVKRSETEKPFKEVDDGLCYKTRLADLEATTLYFFFKDWLWSCMYRFENEHSNNNDYLGDYKSISEILKEKYGEPDHDEEIFKDNLYKGDKDRRGLAIAMGHLRYFEGWSIKGITVSHSLSGENGDIHHGVAYWHEQMSKEAKAAEKADTKKDF